VTFQITSPGGYQQLATTLKWLAVAATLVLAVVILLFAFAPPRPQMSNGIKDKILHFTAFATLVLPCAIFMARSLVWVLPLALAFGGAIELLQPGFGRHASWADFQADVLGVVAGTALGLVLRFLIKRRVSGAKLSRPV